MVGYDGGRVAAEELADHVVVDPLAEHPADPGGAGAAPTTCCASWWSCRGADRGDAPAPARRRVRARVDGVVQGVGFRPFVYRLAREPGLGGWVLNDERGVLLEVEGARRASSGSSRALRAEAPPLARGRGRRQRERSSPSRERGFAIAVSAVGGSRGALVSADIATCADCLAEVLDPADRRHRYPFTNCTNCGPAAHDRPRRPLRPAARRRWPASRCARAAGPSTRTPRDRRFHAQPNACPRLRPARCGWSTAGDASCAGAGDAVAAAARRCVDGRIVAVKGVGGYHLACRAADEAAVAALRARKHREDKPFALMAPTSTAARELIELTAAEEALLAAPERADRDRAPPREAPRWRPSVAPGRPRPRRDAALLAAASPARSPTSASRW